jgi:hypothetical protein
MRALNNLPATKKLPHTMYKTADEYTHIFYIEQNLSIIADDCNFNQMWDIVVS